MNSHFSNAHLAARATNGSANASDVSSTRAFATATPGECMVAPLVSVALSECARQARETVDSRGALEKVGVWSAGQRGMRLREFGLRAARRRSGALSLVSEQRADERLRAPSPKSHKSQSGSIEIVRTILSLARNLQLDAVAEGIETFEQAAILKREGCCCGQGFWFSRPLEAEAAAQLIQTSPRW